MRAQAVGFDDRTDGHAVCGGGEDDDDDDDDDADDDDADDQLMRNMQRNKKEEVKSAHTLLPSGTAAMESCSDCRSETMLQAVWAADEKVGGSAGAAAVGTLTSSASQTSRAATPSTSAAWS
jgi:hypothetical protein